MVFFLNKETFEIEKTFEFEMPIWKSLCFENKIYISGNPSYCISSYSEEVTELKRFDSFECFNRRLYSYSDERGLTCLSTNSNSYIPCNFILPLRDTFLTFSDECVGILKHKEQMEWKCQRIKQL